MRINETGIALIKRFEGCRLTAYKCPAGIWTIGYGHTGDVHEGQSITQEQAEDLLKRDLERFEKGVAHLTKSLTLTPNQFSALVSFAFNLGVTKLASSTLMKRLMKGDTQGAVAEFEKWINAGGKPLSGLLARRQAEKKLFLTD